MRKFLTSVLLVCTLVAGAQSKKWPLSEIIEFAWKNHPQVNMAETQVDNFSLKAEQLRANRIPSLYFNGSQNLNTGRSIDPFTYQYTNQKIFSNQFSLNANMNLFSGFQNNRNILYNELLIQTQQEQVEKIKNDMALTIANQYLQVLLLREQITALDSQMVNTQRSLDRETRLKQEGRSNDLKIKQVKAQWLEEKTQHANLTGNAKSALIQLKNSAAITDADFDIEVPENPVVPSSGDETVASVFAVASKEQAVMKYQEKNEKSKEAYVHVTESARYPSLTLNASLNTGYSSARKLTDISYNTSDLPIGYLLSNPSELVYGTISTPVYSQNAYSFPRQINDNFSQFVGLSLRVPLFTQKLTQTNISQARVQLESAKQETRMASNLLQRDIELALSQYQTALTNEQNAREAMQLQLEIYLDMEKLYKEGSTSLFELLSQKTKYNTAQSTHIRSRYELIFRQLVIAYYKGNPIKI